MLLLNLNYEKKKTNDIFLYSNYYNVYLRGFRLISRQFEDTHLPVRLRFSLWFRFAILTYIINDNIIMKPCRPNFINKAQGRPCEPSSQAHN